MLLYSCAKPGRTQLVTSQLAEVPEGSLDWQEKSYPGYGALGGPSFWLFWVKNRSTSAPDSNAAFSQQVGFRLTSSANFVLYHNGSVSLADGNEFLTSVESAYTTLVNSYGDAFEADPVQNGGKIVIFMYDIQDDYLVTSNSFVGAFFAPRDLFKDDLTKAMYEDPDVILYHDPITVGTLRGRSNENAIIYVDTNPLYNATAFGGNTANAKAYLKDILNHEMSHLLTFYRRVKLGEDFNHETWIAEGIAEQAPQVTAGTNVLQVDRMGLFKNPLMQSFLSFHPSLFPDASYNNPLILVLQSNLFFNYLRSRSGSTGAAQQNLIQQLVRVEDRTVHGVDSVIQSTISGADFSSIYADYVLTNLINGRTSSQPTGLNVTSYTLQGGTTLTAPQLAAKLANLNYSNVTSVDF